MAELAKWERAHWPHSRAETYYLEQQMARVREESYSALMYQWLTRGLMSGSSERVRAT